ncbi:unnamed protein product [Pleuronectes platessa]|uniref:Uncharacterized protein n=1 Tax=Pleuronectes platessa TaxID=8262 RepID=A0A9N7TMX6_PLEPL|nr:unnamed protein product [Pleuronectes platessa]
MEEEEGRAAELSAGRRRQSLSKVLKVRALPPQSRPADDDSRPNLPLVSGACDGFTFYSPQLLPVGIVIYFCALPSHATAGSIGHTRYIGGNRISKELVFNCFKKKHHHDRRRAVRLRTEWISSKFNAHVSSGDDADDDDGSQDGHGEDTRSLGMTSTPS